MKWIGDFIMPQKHSFKSCAIHEQARKREPADEQIEKGENRWTFKIINYAFYHFIL